MRNTPWYHQRRSESAPPADRVKEAPSMSQQEQDDIVDRISRPTESARYRQSLFWKLDGYMEKGFHSWSKMELFDDCKNCMWTPKGTIKSSCKIRPVNAVLPPLSKSGGREVLTNVESRSGSHKGVPLGRSFGSESMCDSRRAVLRPRPSLERSRTNIVTRSTRSSSSSVSHHQNPVRSFLIRSHGNGRIPSHFGTFRNGGGVSNMAVPRLNGNSSVVNGVSVTAN